MKIFLQVSNTPLINCFLSVLQSMLQLDPKDPASDVAWKILKKTVQKMTTISLEEGKKQLAFHILTPKMQPAISGDVADSAVLAVSHLPDSVANAPTSVAPPSPLPPPPPPPLSGSRSGSTWAKPKRQCVKVPKPSKEMKKLNWNIIQKSKLEKE